MKRTIAAMLLLSVSAVPQSNLAPRYTLLEGTANVPSASGNYVITWPPPNECVVIRVKAANRPSAFYNGISLGGFTLKPGNGGLTVWTLEEWESTKVMLGAEFLKSQQDHCPGVKF